MSVDPRREGDASAAGPPRASRVSAARFSTWNRVPELVVNWSTTPVLTVRLSGLSCRVGLFVGRPKRNALQYALARSDASGSGRPPTADSMTRRSLLFPLAPASLPSPTTEQRFARTTWSACWPATSTCTPCASTAPMPPPPAFHSGNGWRRCRSSERSRSFPFRYRWHCARFLADHARSVLRGVPYMFDVHQSEPNEVHAVHVHHAEMPSGNQFTHAVLVRFRLVHVERIGNAAQHAARVVREESRAVGLLRNGKDLERSELRHRLQPFPEWNAGGGGIGAVEAQGVHVEVAGQQADHVVRAKRCSVVGRVGKPVREEQQRPAGHRVRGWGPA